MQDRNPPMDLKAVPGSSQLSVVQREARLKQLELINAKKQSRKPYKRWSVTALLPYNGESQSDWMKASDPWSYHLLPKWSPCHAADLIRVYAILVMDVLLDFVSIVTDLIKTDSILLKETSNCLEKNLRTINHGLCKFILKSFSF